jgi:hypothetical protein
MNTPRTMIFSALLLAAFVQAGPLEDYLAANTARNRSDLVRDLNTSPITGTSAVTGLVAKTSALQAIESKILVELAATGIDPTSVVTGGWEFAISTLLQSFEAAAGDADLERGTLRQATVLQARQAQWKALDPYGVVTPDFGGPNHVRISTQAVRGPSLAEQWLGRKVEYRDVDR